MSQESPSEKRVSKCSGCGTPLTDHAWGIPSKYCEGEELSSPKHKKSATIASPDEDEQIRDLERELAELDLEEERREKQTRIAFLQKRVADKRAKLAAGDVTTGRPEHELPHGPSNVKDLRTLLPKDALPTPLDGLLNINPSSSSAADQTQSLWSMQGQLHGDFHTVPAGSQPAPILSNSWLESRASEMFLRPAQPQTGEKALRIVDFVDNIVPKDEERTIVDGGNTKLVVSYGPKKPRLEQITMSQWVISNTRIFYNLLASRKLNSQAEIQNYLAYTIKVMELSNRYHWASVLKYDNEFRLLQAAYHYPWSFDSNHLHAVILEPIYKPSHVPRSPNRTANPSTQFIPGFIATTNDGRTICRNFNSSRGCSLQNCAYEHVCNRRATGGKACGLNHPGYIHSTQQSTSTQQQNKPATQN